MAFLKLSWGEMDRKKDRDLENRRSTLLARIG
jgi:hypothetical protein